VLGMLALCLALTRAQSDPTPASRRPNGGWGAVWSPRGDRIAFLASDDGLPPEAWVCDRQGEEFRRLTHGGADDLAWSADGRTLSFTSTRRGRAARWRVAIATGQESPQPVPAGLPADTLATPSPDGARVAYTQTDQQYRDLYVVTGIGSPQRVTTGFIVGAVAWSPKGDRIAFDALNALSNGLPQVWLYDLRTTKLAHLGSTGSFGPVWSAHGDFLAYAMLYSSQGQKLAIAQPDKVGKLHRRSLHSGAKESAKPNALPLDARAGDVVKDLLYQGDGLAWSPTADLLAVVVRTEHGQQLRLVKANGKVAATLARSDLKFRLPAWSPDGKRLAFEAVRTGVSAFSEVWVTDARGKKWANLTPSRPSYWALSPAAGGRLFCLGNAAGAVKVWTISTRSGTSEDRPTLVPLPNTDGAVGVAPSPHGDRLLVLKPKEVALLSAEGAPLGTFPLSGAVKARWSPQGDRVAVGLTSETGDGTIALLSVFGEGALAELASVPGADPAWHPDGSALACVRGAALWRVDADGQNAAALATVPVAEGEEVLALGPAWEATGARLAFAVTRATPEAWRHELWVLPVGGEAATPTKVYTEEATTEYAFSPARWHALPSWTAEGRILFSSDRGGAPQVWSVLSDGSDLRTVTPPDSVWAALGPEVISFLRLDSDTPFWEVSASGSNLAPLPWSN